MPCRSHGDAYVFRVPDGDIERGVAAAAECRLAAVCCHVMASRGVTARHSSSSNSLCTASHEVTAECTTDSQDSACGQSHGHQLSRGRTCSQEKAAMFCDFSPNKLRLPHS